MIATLHALSQVFFTANLLDNLKERKIVSQESLETEELKAIASQVTLAIPARNEIQNLSELLPQLLKQNIQVSRIIVLDDESDDGTGELVERLSENHSHLERVAGKKIVSEWRGKVWALHQLLGEVQTPFVVFMDADVRLNSEESLAYFFSAAKKLEWNFGSSRKKNGFISVFPGITDTGSAALLSDQVPLHLYYFLPFFRKYFNLPQAVAGCGQFMLLDVREFRELGGYARLRHSTHDGLQLARLFRGNEFPVHWLDGQKILSVSMYESFREAFRGFSRNSFEADASLPVVAAMSGLLFWTFVLPYILWPFFLANPLWLLSFLYFLYGQRRLNQEMQWSSDRLLTTPVRSMASVGVHLWGAVQAKLSVKTQWRGRILR
jgi:glycosyltransferase involved in cell wall biosynthesis